MTPQVTSDCAAFRCVYTHVYVGTCVHSHLSMSVQACAYLCNWCLYIALDTYVLVCIHVFMCVHGFACECCACMLYCVCPYVWRSPMARGNSTLSFSGISKSRGPGGQSLGSACRLSPIGFVGPPAWLWGPGTRRKGCATPLTSEGMHPHFHPWSNFLHWATALGHCGLWVCPGTDRQTDTEGVGSPAGGSCVLSSSVPTSQVVP